MLAPPVKGARTILRSAPVVKTVRVAQSQDGVTTRHVAAGVSFSVQMLIDHVDNRGRFWSRPKLAWNVRGPHAYNEYTYWRCRDT